MKSRKPSIVCHEIICPHCNTKFTWVIIQTKNRVFTGPYYKPKVWLTEENDFFPLRSKDYGQLGYLDDERLRGICHTLNEGSANLRETKKQAKKMGFEIK